MTAAKKLKPDQNSSSGPDPVSGPDASLAGDLPQFDIDELWAEALSKGNTVSLRVASDSMKPLIATGDRIQVESFPPGQGPHIGEIVLLRTHDGWLVHRIIGAGGRGPSAYFLQKGDAGHHAHQVAPSAILGRVVAIETGRGAIRLDRSFQRFISGAVGRSFQFMDWLMSRGADMGRGKEHGAASRVRVIGSVLIRGLERAVAWSGDRLTRRGQR